MANAITSNQPFQPDRRQSQRMRLIVGLPVRVGRKEGTLVEISRGGARVRHTGMLKTDSEVILAFESGGDQFMSNARVLSSRVVGLGTGEGGGTLFETVLRFAHASAESLATIEQMLGPEPQTAGSQN